MPSIYLSKEQQRERGIERGIKQQVFSFCTRTVPFAIVQYFGYGGRHKVAPARYFLLSLSPKSPQHQNPPFFSSLLRFFVAKKKKKEAGGDKHLGLRVYGEAILGGGFPNIVQQVYQNTFIQSEQNKYVPFDQTCIEFKFWHLKMAF